MIYSHSGHILEGGLNCGCLTQIVERDNQMDFAVNFYMYEITILIIVSHVINFVQAEFPSYLNCLFIRCDWIGGEEMRY